MTQPPLSALADPGLVLVRGSDRTSLWDERKGWIMTVKLNDAQVVMMSAAAQREDRCLARTSGSAERKSLMGLDKGVGFCLRGDLEAE